MMRLLHFLWFLYIHGGDAFATSSLRISYSSLGVSTTIGNSDFVEDGVFMELIRSATNTLTSSDTSENEIEHSYGSASQGQWICNRAAANMQTNFLEGLVLKQAIMNVSSSVEKNVVTIETNPNNTTYIPNHSDENAFELIVKQSLYALIQSDVKRGEFSGNSDGSSSQGRWMDHTSGCMLGKALDCLIINQNTSSTQLLGEEERMKWLRWMKNVPSPLFLDLTSHVRDLIVQNHHTNINPWLSSEHLKFVDMSLEQYITRIGCHIILLPSGAETAPLSLVESTGAHVYGKLLYGGVNRFRLLTSGSTVRRVGEKRESSSADELSHPSWVQLGGLERKYEALDIGPAAVLELTLLPRLWQDLPTVFDKSSIRGEARTDMVVVGAAFGWDPSKMFDRLSRDKTLNNNTEKVVESGLKAGFQCNDALSSYFQNRIGGLQVQIDSIIRRVLDGRNIYSVLGSSGSDSRQRLEAEELAALGLQPVRGLLLYGKPGTGKTLLVREISKAIGARAPKIVSAPELLDRWVGGSERLVRELFREAEEELVMCKMTSGDDEYKASLQSALHVICIDEIDAVFRKRTDTEDSGSITRNSVVNQLLSKLDGVNALPNVLMIGTTNRKELLDEALLRPGRLEVQIEVPLPTETGRRDILKIHFSGLRSKGRLSTPLCCAIDGIRFDDHGGVRNSQMLSKRQWLKCQLSLLSPRRRRIVDLASEYYTGGFSGADIAGLVRNSGSIALARARVDGSGVNGLLITLEDVLQALDEVKA